MTKTTAIIGARIFDGDTWHEGKALVVGDGKVSAIVAPDAVPSGADRVDAAGQILVPGFIDLQVNGGGGVLLNEKHDVDAIAAICAAHAKFGTTALLPTLITDTAEIRTGTIKAGRDAAAKGVPGFIGLHLEGPHLSAARKGVHDPALIRPMEQADLEEMLACRDAFDALMITVAPESTTTEQVAELANAGFIVSLGHTDTDCVTAGRYFKSGARTVTHLFNAMSPLGHREPGVVGATLDSSNVYAGLIADGFHVDPVAMGVALRAKNGPGRIFLVTDAMSTIGTDDTGFLLNGRQIYRKDGRLTLADGTLAGADIDMLSSVRFVHEKLGFPLEEAVRMASVYPAEAVRLEARKGKLQPGFDADFVLLTGELAMGSTWIGGEQVFSAS
ncbi:N-acetylglucosamine-6-phosphate deacetylase [Rhizobiaceae bacterium n13]|uniref:N-acetylglucosamine-6-phosphate deacetylase n=1 Tax=Ferirhizobium litorale TaxID=2927786 RepID=A0AAE3QFU7_9HYPH|nr:N-acetylglucosamine-6-phosphate deacetylase [Fererhizobium litorale]MDI7862312.1 N-acetylglucosamine-6-phosphate deacetylase [Fererhizobium litorale]MDI7922414.1 N-acetylglucosamine-6-phosphate deacetylase [Fererhizobium litorale]